MAEIAPGPAPEVLARLLNGSRFNFLIVSAVDDPQKLDRVILSMRPEGGFANSPLPQVQSNDADDDGSANASSPVGNPGAGARASSSATGCRRTERSRPVGLAVSQSREMKKRRRSCALRRRDERTGTGEVPGIGALVRIVATARDVEDRYIEASVGIHLIDENLQEANNRYRGRACAVIVTRPVVIDRQRHDRIAAADGVPSQSDIGIGSPSGDFVGVDAVVNKFLSDKRSRCADRLVTDMRQHWRCRRGRRSSRILGEVN